MIKKFTAPLLAVLLASVLSFPALADTIRLKDGSVLQGQVVGFKDQQFTVLIGSGSRGRHSRILLYAEDVESIEFDEQPGTPSINNDDGSSGIQSAPTTQPSRPSASQQRPTQPPPSRPAEDTDDETTQPAQRPTNTPANTQNNTQGSPGFFQINTRVRGDNTTNGWTNSGLVVRRGQRLRISATGRVMLGAGRASTPAGLPTLADTGKLMRNEATGALIAVVGDDNDDFIYIGRSREFIAQRDGVLFLGVNESNLNDNTGSYEVTIEAEAR
ncbi:MAG TPA: hypothetical protein VGC89_12320 [Pyrinomonadaceae bacterium]